MSNPIKENNFEAGVGGMSGTSNYSVGYGTFASPDVQQDPAHFETGTEDKSITHSNTTKDASNTGSIDGDVNAIYSKKDVPSPDEIATGLKYELGQMITKDKKKAKQIVLQNCRKDPHYYGNLHMLNITDDDMVKNMQESKHPNDRPAQPKVSSKPDEMKKIFTEMAQQRDNKFVVNSEISNVMKQMWEAKQQRSSWKNGG